MNKIYKAFPGGKHKVLTFSYDDGKLEDRRLVEIFNKNGLRGTFNLNTGIDQPDIRIPKDEWKDLYAGHEVAAKIDEVVVTVTYNTDCCAAYDRNHSHFARRKS